MGIMNHEDFSNCLGAGQRAIRGDAGDAENHPGRHSLTQFAVVHPIEKPKIYGGTEEPIAEEDLEP